MKILNILSSINAEGSQSQKLVEAINKRMVEAYPESRIITRNLAKQPVPHLEAVHYNAFNSDPGFLSDADAAAVFHSDAAISELLDADAIVIGAPLYNFTIPGTLKSWIDQVVRQGRTFKYENGTPAGLLAGKKVYLAIATGGIYSEGPMKDIDFIEPYLRTALGFIGLTDITSFRVEGTKIPGVRESALEKAVKTVSEYSF